MKWEFTWLTEKENENPVLAKERVNKYGAENWELVSAVISPDTGKVSFFFKRPLPPKP